VKNVLVSLNGSLTKLKWLTLTALAVKKVKDVTDFLRFATYKKLLLLIIITFYQF